MKLSDIEKRWRESVYGMENERLHLNITVDIQREPSGDKYMVMIRDEDSTGYRTNVVTTEDVAAALRKYIEE